MYQKFTCIGNLTKDPEAKTINDISMCKFSVAVESGYGDKKKTNFFNCTVWRKLADICSQYLAKGKKVFLEGTIDIQNVEKDNQKRTFVNFNVDIMKMLDKKHEKQDDWSSDDIPF